MTGHESCERIVEWLSSPAAYPHAPATVEVIETHISWVFLAGDLVYKLKKPVRFDFLDFSSTEHREQACREELRLNLRLAPNTYLEVVSITDKAGKGFCLGGNGAAIDWLVKMRRLPTERTLDALLRRGEMRPELIDRLTELLARFYRGLPPVEIDAAEYRKRCIAHIQGNRHELLAVSHHLAPSAVKRIHATQLEMLLLQAPVFNERVAADRIVEGHGDLRPEHICFTDPPAVFDCIEFSLEFRQLDVADELAFLAAECDYLGATWIGRRLLEQYRTLSGDLPPDVVLAFYKSYRACVRAKVAALRADQVVGAEREAATVKAVKYLQLAEHYIRPWQQPLVLLIGGLPGSGKSTLATALSQALGAELLRTDVIRRELFGPGTQPAAIDGGVYRPFAREQVYAELLTRAASLHHERVSVVLDGTFATARQVRAAQAVANQLPARFLAIECICPTGVALDRIRRRLAEGNDPSEARPDVYNRQRQDWEAWPEEILQVKIDTQQPLDEQVTQVVSVLTTSPRGQ